MYNPTNDNDMNGNYYSAPPSNRNMARRPHRNFQGMRRGRGGFGGQGGYGGGGSRRYGQMQEFELIPEFELEEHPPQRSYKGGLPGDPATGWENDNESFTKKVAEQHLKIALGLNERVEPDPGCSIDPDFFTRRCNFTSRAKKITGTLTWSPLRKQVDIVACVNGKKLLCSYDYFVKDDKLLIKNMKCLKPIDC